MSDRIDEAFVPLGELVPLLLPDLPDLVDEQAGVRSSVTGLELETPVELDITVDDDVEERAFAAATAHWDACHDVSP